MIFVRYLKIITTVLKNDINTLMQIDKFKNDIKSLVREVFFELLLKTIFWTFSSITQESLDKKKKRIAWPIETLMHVINANVQYITLR